ncbi:MAG: acyltransferase [Bacteriovorax sp.]|nr:acyltransferase [Bacteriovorax sp.]
MLKKLIKNLFFKDLYKKIIETSKNQTPVKLKIWFFQKIIGFNKEAYWPVHFTSIVTGVENIYAGIDTSPGYMPGCYIQGIGKIYIGDYTQISANVGIITANHDLYDSRKHMPNSVVIGKYSWIGMNAMILPGVVLGDFTIVGAGSVVTKSFADGYCVIGGNPAKVIKRLDKDRCIPFRNEYEYFGYLNHEEFSIYRSKYLNI